MSERARDLVRYLDAVNAGPQCVATWIDGRWRLGSFSADFAYAVAEDLMTDAPSGQDRAS